MNRDLLICVALAFLAGCGIRIVSVPAPPVHFAKRADTSSQREQFDPEPYSQDLLLIQPKFAPPPTVDTVEDAPAASIEDAHLESRTDEIRTGSGDLPRIIYRVQIIALRDSAAATRLAGQLRQRLPVEVDVTLKNRLRMVRAGRFDTSDAAKKLKTEIIALGGDFSEAYVVTEFAGAVRSPASPPAPVPASTPLESDLPLADSPLVQSPFPDEDEALELDPPEPELVRMAGWRVLIFQDRDYEKAQRALNLARTKLGRNIDVDIKLEGPLNKVLVGNYRTENEAKRAAESIKRWYPNAFKVRAMVYLPSER